MFARCKNRLLHALISIGFILAFASWKTDEVEEPWKWIQRCLLQSFNQLADTDLKKWDLSVTPEGFFRLRKYYPSGKQEYFSFHFTKLKNVEYTGTPDAGDILFKTVEDDIIVQTYNDPKGNIDSMSTTLKLPVLNLQPKSIDSLRNALMMFK